MRSLKRHSLAFTCFLVIIGCRGEDFEETGNASLIIDATEEVALEDLGITLNRIKVWKSTPNNTSPGVSTVIDQHTVEIWVTVAGEAGARYAKFSGLLSDNSGNLYQIGAEPGRKSHKTYGTRLVGAGVLTYEIDSKDAFIEGDFPVATTWAEITGDGDSVTELLNAAEFEDSPWITLRYREVTTELASRFTYQENTDFATTGGVGCLVKAADASAEIEPRTQIFSNIELGAMLQDKEGLQTSGASNSLGDDDALWINWEETWFLSGININQRKLRVFRSRTAPYYANRELPGVDAGDDSPKPSGLENLLRQCNGAAARTGGSFRLIYLSGSFSERPNLTIGSPITYCEEFGDAFEESFDLSSYGGCGWSLTEVIQGPWDGTTHLGPVESAHSVGFSHFEQTEITEVDF